MGQAIERLNAKYVQLIVEKMAKLHTSRRAPLENLVKTVFHPSRVKRMISTHGINYLNKV